MLLILSDTKPSNSTYVSTMRNTTKKISTQMQKSEGVLIHYGNAKCSAELTKEIAKKT